jgi:hypothetical protein
MKMCKIKFTAYCTGWTDDDGIMSFKIKASVGSEVYINWGDGPIKRHLFSDENPTKFRHDYFPKLKMPLPDKWFQVEIGGENRDCRIIGFEVGGTMMDVYDLDVTNCPELEELTYYAYGAVSEGYSLDLSRNTKLKYLDCSNSRFTSLDLSNNTALETLYCNFNSDLKQLSLENNINLKEVDLQCNRLEKIYIYYAPQLRYVGFDEDTNLDDDTKARLQEIISENDGEINEFSV